MKGPMYFTDSVVAFKAKRDQFIEMMRSELDKVKVTLPSVRTCSSGTHDRPGEQKGTLRNVLDGILEDWRSWQLENVSLSERLEKLTDQSDENEKLKASLAAVKKELDRVSAESDAKSTEIRRLSKEIDPDEIRLRIMYSAEEISSNKDKEIGELKSANAKQASEIEDLKRSKRKLRDALDRLKDET